MQIQKLLEKFITDALTALEDPSKTVQGMRAISGRCLSKAVLVLKILSGEQFSKSMQKLVLDKSRAVLLEATNGLD